MNREAIEQTLWVMQDVKARQLPFNICTFVGYRDEDGDQMGMWRKSSVTERFEKHYAEAGDNLMFIPHACGANACATGYAGLTKWFRDRGWVTEANGSVAYHFKAASGDEYVLPNWDGMLKFYDLTEEEGVYLFAPEYYEKKDNVDEVIQRLQEVLRYGFPKDHSCFGGEEGKVDDDE